LRKIQSRITRIESSLADIKAVLFPPEEKSGDSGSRPRTVPCSASLSRLTLQTPEEEEEVHAHWDDDEEGFLCDMGTSSRKGCDLVYEADEIVEHLEKVHKLDEDDMVIEGWTKKHDRILARARKKAKKKKRKRAKEVEPEEILSVTLMAQYPSGKIIPFVIPSQQLPKELLARLQTLLSSQSSQLRAEPQEEEVEEVEKVEFTKKDIRKLKREWGLTDDQLKLVVDYAVDEGISLDEAAETLIGSEE